jgi:hypothetical protein
MRSLLILLLVSTSARAAPPLGADLNPTFHKWWECLGKSEKGTAAICCTLADGHLLNDGEWQVGQDSNNQPVYQVRISPATGLPSEGGVWYDVPKAAIITTGSCGNDPNPETATDAKVWYAPHWSDKNDLEYIEIYCFLRGTEY